MKPDFGGYATKANLRCRDGRVIVPGAFRKQDQQQVPLLWQHGHDDPENVVGHAILESREDGTYTYAYFNDTPRAKQLKEQVMHGDINRLSIWANNLVEKSKHVLDGVIREVSLVIAGANPGATIDNVYLQHDGGEETYLDDEYIIHTGLEISVISTQLQHDSDDESDDESEKDAKMAEDTTVEVTDDTTVEDIYNGMTKEQKDVVHFLVGSAVEDALAENGDDDEEAGQDDGAAEHSALSYYKEGINDAMNLFEQTNEAALAHSASGADTATQPLDQNLMTELLENAKRTGGTLKHSLEQHMNTASLQHNFEDVGILFPDSALLVNEPQRIARRREWVSEILTGVTKRPFARIKTIIADMDFKDARAKGYVKGTEKEDTYLELIKRETTPTTIYRKKKIDRDDVIDITTFDSVAWMKSDLRTVLEEEVARAILLGDGRSPGDPDYINRNNVRPIALDHELYTTTINVNLGDANSSPVETIDAIAANHGRWRGTGRPIAFMAEVELSKILVERDSLGRRIYRTLDEIAAEMRVAKVVSVEIMEEYPDIVAVVVNPADYVTGTDKGGAISMFDDFDIDFNQYKYLIETRLSGALAVPKSALVIKRTASSSVLVAPTAPTQAGDKVSIPTVTGVTYKNGAGTTLTTASSPYTITPGTDYVVNATANSGYHFATSDDDSWTFEV